jgi:hypothetical protein
VSNFYQPFEDAIIEQMLAEGHNARVIGEQLGRKTQSVNKRVQILGLSQPKSWSQDDIKKLERMAPRYTVTSIAAALKRCPQAVRGQMRRMGILPASATVYPDERKRPEPVVKPKMPFEAVADLARQRLEPFEKAFVLTAKANGHGHCEELLEAGIRQATMELERRCAAAGFRHFEYRKAA